MRRFERHALTAGIEYRNNLRQNQSAMDETGVLLDDRRGSQTVGMYAEDEFRISSKVLLNAGLRFDDYFAGFGSTREPARGADRDAVRHHNREGAVWTGLPRAQPVRAVLRQERR